MIKLRRLGRKGSRTWYACFSYTDGRGLTHRVRKSTKTDDKTTAMQIASAWYQECTTNIDDAGAPRRAAFSGFARRWFDDIVAVDLSPSTGRAYWSVLRHRLVPWFGDADLREIGVEDVQRLKAWLVEETAPRTVRNVLSVLSSLMSTAVLWGYADTNPCDQVRAVRLPPTAHRAWTRAEVDAFLAYIEKHESVWLAPFGLMLLAGLRMGELLALTWDDVQLSPGLEGPGELQIRAALARDRHGKTHIKAPKSGRARAVPIPQRLVDILRRHPRRLDTQLVVARDDGGHLSPTLLRHPFRRACEGAGVPLIRFHDLRHTYATHLAQAGVPMPTLQVYLGHSDIKTTMIYARHAPREVGTWVSVLDAAPAPVANNLANNPQEDAVSG